MNFWNRRRRERELEAELRGHLEMSSRDRVERGETRADAELKARREFGNQALVQEVIRDVWGWGALERFGKDLRYSLRALRRSPAFTVIAVATLALGIGATTALFSAIEAVLLRPLPYANPKRLVWVSRPSPKLKSGVVLTPQFAAWRGENHSFEALAAWNDEQFNLTGAGEPERLVGASVNADFLRTLGVAPYLGRDFEFEQDRGANPHFVLLGYDLWQRHFAASAACIGRQVALNDTPHTITGVLPRGFRFPGDLRPELLVAGGFSNAPQWGAERIGLLRVIGRPREGVPDARIVEEIEAIERLHEADRPSFYRTMLGGGRVKLTPLAEQLNGSVRRPLLVLWTAVSLVLLLICANVAGLQLARSSARSGELAVRAALGAGRGRLVRLIAGESLLVACAGGGLGILGAFWLIEALRKVTALNLPSPEAVQLNGMVLAFAVAITLATGLLAGLAPALAASRPDLADTIKASSRSVTRGWSGGLRGALVIGEVAMALVLLLGAGLLLRSMQKLLTVPLGFDPERVLTLRIRLSGEHYRDDRTRAAFVDDLVARARALPGVRRAAMTSTVPLTGYNLGLLFQVEGQPPLPAGQRPGAAVLTVTPDYFAAAGVPLLAGRGFGASDAAGAAPVAIVNRSFAQTHFGRQDPVGRRLQFGNGVDPAGWITIVGMAADTRQQGPLRPAEPEIFRPNGQMPANQAGLVVRTIVPPESLVRALREEVRQIDPELPLFDIQTMDERVARATASQRLELGLIGFFAAVAIVLAALGVYGVIAYAVSQSTHEIGLRLALGAPAAKVQRAVVGRGMRMGVAGVALGLAGGYGLTRYLRTLLFETREHDAATFVSAAAVLLGMALLASWLPARRAARVDPVVALRCE